MKIRYLNIRKSNITISIVLLMIILLLNIAHKIYRKDHFIPYTSIKRNDKAEIILDKWRVVGPFISSDSILNLQLGHSDNENPFVKKCWNKLFYTKIKNDHEQFHVNRIISDTSGFFDLKGSMGILPEVPIQTSSFFITHLKINDITCFYLALAGNSSYNIWVNGKLITKTLPYHGYLIQYQFFQKIKLRKGPNMIIVESRKEDNKIPPFFKLALLKRKPAVHYFSEYLDKIGILQETLISSSDNKININQEIINFGFDSINICDHNNKLIYSFLPNSSDHHNIKCDFSLNSVYKVTCHIDSEIIEQYLFVGEMDYFYKFYNKYFRRSTSTTGYDKYIRPLADRYYLLTKNHSNLPTLKRKKVYIISKLADYYHHITQGNDFPIKEGVNIHGFISDIDKQLRYYLVMAPDSIDPNYNYPLILETHFGYDKNHHFLTGNAIYNHFHNHYSRLANKYNIILVISPMRLYLEEQYLPPIAEREFFNVLNEVSTAYKIDTNRIFIYGPCGGARRAINMCENHPDLFAGLLMGGLSYKSNSVIHEKYDIISRIDNLKNIHIFSQHDYMDDHSPYYFARDFLDQLELKNEHFNQTVTNYNRQIENKINDYLIESIIDKTKIQNCTAISFKSWRRKTNNIHWVKNIEMDNKMNFFTISGNIKGKVIYIYGENIASFTIKADELPVVDPYHKIRVFYNNKEVKYRRIKNALLVEIVKKDPVIEYPGVKNEFVEGPVWEVFGNPVLFIQKNNVNSKKEPVSSDSIIKRWNSYFHTNINTYGDTIQDSLKSQNNLVLFGNPWNNSIINDVKDLLPIMIFKDSICFGNKTYKGNNLCYQLCYPSPFNPKHYILIIGGNNMPKFIPYQTMPWYEGLSDYYIWQSVEDQKELLLEGDFDEKWKI